MCLIVETFEVCAWLEVDTRIGNNKRTSILLFIISLSRLTMLYIDVLHLNMLAIGWIIAELYTKSTMVVVPSVI